MFHNFHEKILAERRKQINESLSATTLHASGSAHSFHEPLTTHGFTHVKSHQSEHKIGDNTHFMIHHDYYHPKGHQATVSIHGDPTSTEPHHVAMVAHDQEIKGQTHRVFTPHADVHSLTTHLKGLEK